MSRPLKIYISALAASSAIALVAASVIFGIDPGIAIQFPPENPSQASILLGLGYWILLTMFASALPVRLPRGLLIGVSIAPVIAAINLGGPAAGGWVALIGSTEVRELRGRIPWYGTVANHSAIVIPAIAAGVVMQAVRAGPAGTFADFLAVVVSAGVYFALNLMLASIVLSLRTGQPLRYFVLGDAKAFWASLLALAPLGWLMARIYAIGAIGWWATLLFALPLYTYRVAHHRFAEMREMFTQTIGALAEAVDKRDLYTSKHSQRVKQIGVEIGREMGVREDELEALEWGGLLHDVGKIGVPDAVLLKQDRLTREERMIMNLHPVLGAQIIAPVTKLAPELPIIRHHHEWYNGSGYPDRLIGDEIPKLARILHVADAFEAMTAARPYRLTPLSAAQAIAELRKFAGIQFDPEVVEAFVQTSWADGVADPARPAEPRPIPMIGQAAKRIKAGQTDIAPGR